ncbi:flagellar hook-associated protein 1 FlgK [Nocardioides daedukensis]|uniref:Flagellar hook-associated protein 1 n=1 Tax=Nocardioides daedukensis TaxID=634462 RepID=A0A7Y9S0G5_9ACTN|nr:flagellar hook-associated protein FlgK [Nocardioides daedukensis]NYG58699.1 flagellar hook-associated protein 1 FlgK [Nocardioides daedukensis]
MASFNTALSGLRYSQVAMDVASNNLANVGTDGYVRRRVVGASSSTQDVAGLWSRGNGVGDGVTVAGIDRLANQFLDVRARKEHGTQAFLDTRGVVLDRVEAGIGEPGTAGVSAALASYRSSWQNLSNNPGNEAARSQVLVAAETLVDAFAVQHRNVVTEEEGLRSQLLVNVREVNILAADLARTNQSIAEAQGNGIDAGTLLDQRDSLTLKLSEMTGASGTVRADGGMDVALNGVSLVAGNKAGTLELTAGVNPDGSGGGAVALAITTSSGTTMLPAGISGEVGAIAELLTTTLPSYRAGLDAVAQDFADEMNAAHQAGFDLEGNPGQALFSYTPPDVVASLQVALSDGKGVAASAIAGGGLDGSNADLLSTSSGVEGSYQRLVAVFGTEVASVHRLAANQQVLTKQVDNSRESLSGVSIDEEMVNLVSAQRSYEAASRVMTVMDSVLDTLINRTGLVR